MPTYPTIPLVQFYNNSVEVDTRAARVEQGQKGGVIDRAKKHFKNATRKTYQISATLKDRDELQTFLESNRGTPFEFLYDGKSDPSLYVCKGWSFTWIVYAEGNGVWKFTGNLEQVYRPGYIPFRSESNNLVFAPVQLSGAGEVAGDFQPVGTGSLQTSPVVVSGTGAYTGIKTGSGNLLLSSVTMSGVGSITLVGTGAIELAPVTMTGSSTAGPPVIGSGNLSTDAIVLSGTGERILNGSGGLSIVAPTSTGLGGLSMLGAGGLEAASISVSSTGSITPNSTLLNSLLAWWSLNETSGNRADSHTGGRNLIQVGTVVSVTGKVGNAANFSNSLSNYLASSDSAFSPGNTTFYIAGWLRIASSTGSNQAMLTRWNITGNQREYQLVYANAGGTLVFSVSPDGSGATSVSTAISLATTYFVEVYHNAATDQIGIALNGGTFTTAAHSTGVFQGSAEFRVGRYTNADAPLNGWVDELAIWSRILTSGERTDLYNSGSGITYPG